jgi:lipopolysaccharide transport system ATP-binding protein
MEDLGQSGRTVLFVSHNMQAVAQLCDRVLLLDGGKVVRDGPSAEVVAEYLQAGHGSGATRGWDALDEAPGDDLVRLRSARVLQDGAVAGSVDVRKPVGIEIGFTVLKHGDPVFPKIKVFDRQGDVAFNALDTSPRWQEPAEPGEHVSTAWIPGNLLNEGLISVDVAVCSLDGTKFNHRAGEPDALSFHVHDPGQGDSARGQFVGQVRGVVRPLLEWSSEER